MSQLIKPMLLTMAGFLTGLLCSQIIFSEVPIRSSHYAQNPIQELNSLKNLVTELDNLVYQQKQHQLNVEILVSQINNQTGFSNDAAVAVVPSARISEPAAHSTRLAEPEHESMEEYTYTEAFVEDNLFSGYWSVETAMETGRRMNELPHEQRSQLQLKIIRAINDGTLELEDATFPLF